MVYAPYNATKGWHTVYLAEADLYNGLSRTTWSIGVSIVIILCHFGCGGRIILVLRAQATATFFSGFFFIFFCYFCSIMVIWGLGFLGWGVGLGFKGWGFWLIGFKACSVRLIFFYFVGLGALYINKEEWPWEKSSKPHSVGNI